MMALAAEVIDEKACVGDNKRYESLISAGDPGSFSWNIRPSALRFVSAARKETRVWRTGEEREVFVVESCSSSTWFA